jgi:hypothetical protein
MVLTDPNFKGAATELASEALLNRWIIAKHHNSNITAL